VYLRCPFKIHTLSDLRKKHIPHLAIFGLGCWARDTDSMCAHAHDPYRRRHHLPASLPNTRVVIALWRPRMPRPPSPRAGALPWRCGGQTGRRTSRTPHSVCRPGTRARPVRGRREASTKGRVVRVQPSRSSRAFSAPALRAARSTRTFHQKPYVWTRGQRWGTDSSIKTEDTWKQRLNNLIIVLKWLIYPYSKIKYKIDFALHILVPVPPNLVSSHLFGTFKYF
jgi:hypothetical protein